MYDIGISVLHGVPFESVARWSRTYVQDCRCRGWRAPGQQPCMRLIAGTSEPGRAQASVKVAWRKWSKALHAMATSSRTPVQPAPQCQGHLLGLHAAATVVLTNTRDSVVDLQGKTHTP